MPRHSILRAAALLALAAAPATAFGQGTEEQQQACTPDAVKLCSDTIPDIPKTTACMKSHFSQLSPRCQTAFGEATGGAKPATKIVTRKPEPRIKTATRAERRMPERVVPREEAAAPPPREASEPATPAQVAGFPPFPAADAPLVRTPASAGIAKACRDGLIDSFTCSTTVPALLGGPAY